MLMSAYHVNLSSLKALRFIAYYSYNWYLWHPVFVMVFIDFFNATLSGLVIYLLFTFSIAVLATILIEEPALARRASIMKNSHKTKGMATKS